MTANARFIKWLAVNMQPINTVDSPHFKDFVENIPQGWKVPSRYRTCMLIESQHYSYMEKLRLSTNLPLKAVFDNRHVDIEDDEALHVYYGISSTTT